MRPIVFAAIRTGLIDPDVIAQFKKWGMIPRDANTAIIEEPDVALELIQEALDSREQVEVRDTDLDVLRYYLTRSNQRKGQIVLVDHTDKEGTNKSTKTVTFARRVLSTNSSELRVEYIIPWTFESIEEILTNGQTYLRYTEDDKHMKVYLCSIRYLYFGDAKAFMVCEGQEVTNERH